MVAFGLIDGPVPDIFLVALAALDVLADRSAEAPLLIVVEDAHWLDQATCDVLAFIARRVETEAIALLLGARDDPASKIEELGLPELRLGPLDDSSARRLLVAHAPDLENRTRQRLLEVAEGNPLALIEFPHVLSSDSFPLAPEMNPLPMTERLERAFAGRATDLPSPTRKLLLVAALDEGAVLGDMLAAASLTGDPTTLEDLDPAEEAGLVSIIGERLTFRHPLVRGAIYHTASASDKQAAHRALGEALAEDPDRSAWHRAASLTRPDDRVSAELESVGDRALHRGAPTAAAAAFRRGAEVSRPNASRGRLLIRAAEIEFELGRNDLALHHLEEAKQLPLGHEELTRLRLMLEASDEDSWSGPARVAAFAELANQSIGVHGPDMALKSLLPVAVGCWWGNPTERTRDLVVAAAESLRVSEDHPALLAVLACANPVQRGAVVIDRISQISPDATDDPVALHLVGTAATAVLAFDLSWEFLSRAVEGLRAQGRLGLLAQALVSQSWAAVHLAKETVAMSAADEAGRLA